MIRMAIKQLSKNDLGLTGSHQAGFLVPKDLIKRNFFPFLDPTEENPRVVLSVVCDKDLYSFNLIYYNNRLFGKGTRNEYRMTGLSKFYRAHGCEIGDSLKFIYNDRIESYQVEVLHKNTSYEISKKILDRPLIIQASWAY